MMNRGERRENVDLHQFSLRRDDFERGLGLFRGKLVRPLPVVLQTEADEALRGWGCGIFTARDTLAMFGRQTEAETVMRLAFGLGASREEGVDGETMCRLLRHFGLLTESRKVESSAEIGEVTAKGGVVLAAVIGHDWRKKYRSRWQNYDSHWVVVPAADERRVVVIDSDLRASLMGEPISGVYTMPWERFSAIDYYFEGGWISPSGDFVWGESLWYQNEIMAVSLV